MPSSTRLGTFIARTQHLLGSKLFEAILDADIYVNELLVYILHKEHNDQKIKVIEKMLIPFLYHVWTKLVISRAV